MSIPVELYRKIYHEDNYNCSHFAVDVYNVYYDSNIVDDLSCFLLPYKDRFADMSIRHKFIKVDYRKTIKGDIVVLHNPQRQSHVAVKLDKDFIQLSSEGVIVVSWELLNIGFNRAKVYRHVSNSICL